jgi:hypothetical protein
MAAPTSLAARPRNPLPTGLELRPDLTAAVGRREGLAMGRRLWAGSGAHTDELTSLARRAARMDMQIASSSLSLSGMGRGRSSYGMRGQGIRLPRGRGEPENLPLLKAARKVGRCPAVSPERRDSGLTPDGIGGTRRWLKQPLSPIPIRGDREAKRPPRRSRSRTSRRIKSGAFNRGSRAAAAS